ncbi:MAG: peptide chain release factor-like protein [Deltaproteobacteria bacterium]|nr:peptide chain release factor-like protein [Deltaproteobacteria bacterium]
MTRPPPYATDRESLERDCQVEFIVAGGPGGQHRNRSRTGVRMSHEASGLVIMATERRSQHQNLETAYERMTEALRKRNHVPKKRRPTRPSGAQRAKRIQNKKQRGQTKEQRRKPGREDG